MASKAFFDAVRRPLYRGRLKQHQVDGLNRVIAYGIDYGFDRADMAYALATAHHETGGWMQPIREGAHRFGPKYTNEQSIRAVTSIYSKGIIRTNYALPDGPWKQAYYGRGLVQITWYDNYLRMGRSIGLGDALAKKPDMALEWDIALPLLFVGMKEGLYTGKALSDYNLPSEFYHARRIINGDVRKNGTMIAGYAKDFYAALEHEYD